MHRWFESKQITQAYSKYRPLAPSYIRDKSLSFLKERSPSSSSKDTGHDLLVDVGCGNGQTSQIFNGDFRKIVGVDPSENQIKEARKKHSNNPVMKYLVGSDTNLPIESGSADMVIAGQSVHWFNFEKFYKECSRVLKPNGCLTLYGYDRPRVALVSNDHDPKKFFRQKTESDFLISEFLSKCHYDERSQLVENHYLDVFFDLKTVHKVYTDNLNMSRLTTLEEYIKQVESYSGYQNYISDKVRDFVQASNGKEAWRDFTEKYDIREQLRKSLRKCWDVDHLPDEEIRLLSTWQVFLILSEKPNY